MRYAAGIEYGGSAYCGWQRQPHCESVQARVEAALAYVADHSLELVCAGRTDAGVHALEQVVHFDSSARRDTRAWLLGANCRLPRDIRIRWVEPVSDDFHARFSAEARAYRYIILNAPVASALFHDRASWEFRALDEHRMQAAAGVLVGEHDFSSFRAVGCQARSSRREVHSVEVSRHGDLIYIDIKANAFLYHMVRNIAGSLIAVGRGERSVEWFAELLAARDRNIADVTAPAQGLYFLRAWYPTQFKLPTSAQKPVLFRHDT